MTDPRFPPAPPPGSSPAGHPGHHTPVPGHHTPLPPTMAGGLPGQTPPGGQWWPGQGGHPGPGRPRWRRQPRWVVLLAVATAVLSVASFTTVLLWPAGAGDGPPPSEPLSFHPFQQTGRVEFGERTNTAYVEMLPDRAYVGWQQGEDLQVASVNLPDGSERWRRQVSGDPEWGEVFAIPNAVIVVGADSSGATHMYVLDAGGGAELWRRDVSGDDWVSATSENVVWYHEPDALIRGIDIATGTEEWSLPVSPQVASTWALTGEDLALPTDIGGYIGVIATDPRLVVLDEDRAAQVLDAAAGAVVGQAANIAGPNDTTYAYQGRLYAASDEAGFQLVSYDLANLGGLPATHYRAGAERRPHTLDVCGGGRVCLLERDGSDAETTEIVAVDVAEGAGELWRQPAPGGETLISVGPWILVTGGDQVLAFDAGGSTVVNRPGSAARLDSGNLLVFASDLTEYGQDLSVAGMAVGEQQPVELGQVVDVIGAQCSWNQSFLACPDREGTTIWRFADPVEDR